MRKTYDARAEAAMLAHKRRMDADRRALAIERRKAANRAALRMVGGQK